VLATELDTHLYEVAPLANGEPNGTYLAVTSVRGSSDAEVDRARASAEGAARRYLDRHPGCAAVGVYHSYPSPGPRRVFVCELRR
jgi:hypothetical protein